MKYKTFSEGVSSGTPDIFELKPTDIRKAAAAIERPEAVEKAIDNLRIMLMKGELDPKKAEGARKIVKDWLKTVWKKESLAKQFKGKAARNLESNYINFVLNSTKSLPESAAQTATKVEKVLKTTLSPEQKGKKILEAIASESKTLQKGLSKSAILRILPKITPWIASGIAAMMLVGKIRGYLVKETPEAFTDLEHGEYYHPDVGWYE